MSEKYRKKVKVAVIFGGYSSEYSVSLESSGAVIKNLDPEKYEVLPVGITKEGEWFSYTGPVENIENDLAAVRILHTGYDFTGSKYTWSGVSWRRRCKNNADRCGVSGHAWKKW